MLNKLKKLFVKTTSRPTNFFRCWITVLIPEYQEALFAELVKMGYSVSLIATPEQTKTANKNHNCSYVIPIFVYHSSFPDLNSEQVYKDIKYLLDDMKAYYFSIIVAITNDACWVGSNIINNQIEYLLPTKSKNDNIN